MSFHGNAFQLAIHGGLVLFTVMTTWPPRPTKSSIGGPSRVESIDGDHQFRAQTDSHTGILGEQTLRSLAHLPGR